MSSSETKLSSGGIAGIVIATTVVAIAIAVVLWYFLDAQYINYGNSVSFSIDPVSGNSLYIMLQAGGAVTTTDVKDSATKFQIVHAEGAGSVLEYGDGSTTTQTTYFKFYDPITKQYIGFGAVSGQYTYMQGQSDEADGMPFTFLHTSTSSAGGRIKPETDLRIFMLSGSDSAASSVVQYKSQLNTGIAGLIICGDSAFTCDDVDWTIHR